MPRELNGGFANFYDSLALYPEVGKYRCFGANWSKRLYDDIEEVIQKQDALNKALARKWKATNEADGGATLLDVPRSFVSKEEVEIKEKWGQYEEALTKYSQNLLLSQQVFNLPRHASYANKYLRKWKFFDTDGNFGPTGEDWHRYEDTSHQTDTCAVTTHPQTDMLSTFFINHSEWFQENVINRLERCFRRKKHPDGTKQTDIPYEAIVMVMDAVVCFFVPVLFDMEMFALIAIKPLKVRIAIVGVFGLIFSLSLKCFAGHLTRGEVFATTAAYFAVASVFVGTTSDNIVFK